jgi:hypothetical protein
MSRHVLALLVPTAGPADSLAHFNSDYGTQKLLQDSARTTADRVKRKATAAYRVCCSNDNNFKVKPIKPAMPHEGNYIL